MKKLFTAILIVLCLGVLFAMPASAEEYTDPLATKFDDTVGYCDTFYDTLEWYAICKVSWTFVDWDYEGEPPLVQVPAAEYEAELAKYCVLSEELLSAIRNYTYYGDPIYNSETDTYTAFFVGGWGGYLHNRLYAGYVKTGEDTYDVYYETVTFEFLEDLLPEGTTVEDIAGEDWPYTVEYEGYTYANSPDGYYRIKSYDKCGVKYGVKVENGRVLLATRTPYAVGEQPEDFDDVTTAPVEDPWYLTYEIVDGEAIITDCDTSVEGDITLPNTLGGCPVTGIESYAFLWCESLSNITISDSITSIGNSAFEWCSGLISITIPDSVTSIGSSAFLNCSSLTEISIPECVTSIGDCAFQSCSSLTNITIPDSVTSIGLAAFQNCSSLTGITISDSVTSIGNSAFSGCSSLSGIWVSENNPYYSIDAKGVLFDKEQTTLICAPGGISSSYTVPDSVTSIGNSAFWGCSSLTDITIPECVTSISYSAFQSCSNLTEITIPDSVTDIGHSAFEGCSSLTSIIIPDSITSIGDSAFYGCSSLTGIWVSENNSNYSSDTSGVLFDNEQTTLICAPGGISGSYIVPDGVTSISEDAFYKCSSLTSITIPDSVTSIGRYAFSYCSSLTSITIPDSVTSIGGSAFSGCSSLTSITIPDSITSIGDSAFYGCSSLTSITIPDSITSIDDYAFSDCSSLTSITIPDGVTNIGRSAFEGCGSLTDVYYSGTEEQWEQIDIGYYNKNLTSANIHFVECAHSYDNACDTTCNNCGEIRATSHNYKTTTTKATLSKNGSIVEKCSVCGKVESTTLIAKPTTFTVSTVNYTYNGVVKTPGVTVKDANGKVLTKGTDYTVSYPSGRTALGTYTVTITMKGNYSGTKTLTFNIKLGTPTVTVANAANGVKVSWNNISGATSYKVYRSVYTNGAWSSWTAIKTGVTGMTYTDTSVKSNNNVKYTVRAFNGSHSSTYKASSSIKFLAAPTVTVSNDANGVKITWNAIAGAKNYKVYKSVYANGAWSGWKAIKTGVTGTTYTDTSVKSNDNVKYTVRAFNGNFSSTYKSSSSIKFLATPTVKAANAAKGVTVTWNKITGAKTYTVYRSVYSGGKWSGWTAIKTGVTGTSYTDTTVKSGATVRYTVKAINGNFRSNVKTGNTTKFLAQPTVKVAKATNGIKASWGKVSGATGYIVYRRTYTNGKWSGWTAIKTTTAVSFTDTTAKKGVTYQYTVRAYSGDCRSSYTNSSSIKR